MVEPLTALMGGQILTSALGGIFGRRDAKRAQRAQERQARLALGEVRGGLNMARQYLDQQLDVARGIEESVLGSLDATFAQQVRSLLNREREERARLEANFEGSGLNTTTLASGLRAQQQGMGSRALAELGARFALERGNVTMAARQPVLQSLGNRASMEFAGGQALGQIQSGIQYQAPNTGAAIGALGGGLVSTYLQGQQLDILRDALKAPLPTRG